MTDAPETYPVASCALYLYDYTYGGPEEGGWYYDTYQLVDLDEARTLLPYFWQPRFSEQTMDADRSIEMPSREFIDYVAEANMVLDHTVNKDRREIGSVLSEGIYRVCWFDGMPASRPTTRPYYE
jgi:hypothetical protein